MVEMDRFSRNQVSYKDQGQQQSNEQNKAAYNRTQAPSILKEFQKPSVQRIEERSENSCHRYRQEKQLHHVQKQECGEQQQGEHEVTTEASGLNVVVRRLNWILFRIGLISHIVAKVFYPRLFNSIVTENFRLRARNCDYELLDSNSLTTKRAKLKALVNAGETAFSM